MSKYNEEPITLSELADVQTLIKAVDKLELYAINLDHIQLGDANKKILGKLQFRDGRWLFHARRHDKPAVLGE